MHKYLIIFLSVLMTLTSGLSYSASTKTHRVPEFSNDKVNVWQTTIYPGSAQVLSMHRHEHNRVVVAFDDGELKIKNDKGDVHYLKLTKNKAYYLQKDVPGELHSDENISHHPIKVLVVELND